MDIYYSARSVWRLSHVEYQKNFIIIKKFIKIPGWSLAPAPSGVSMLGCWLCVTSCRLGGIGCWPTSGPRAGTLLALCNCCFFDTFETSTEAIGWIGFVPLLLLVPGVEDLESEKVLRFFRSAANAPRPWANMWCPSWWCEWCEWCEWCVWISWPGVSKEDFESVDPSDLEPPSSDAGEYTESSERDLPKKARKLVVQQV